jgi:uncharacterized membrane protein YvbJ
MRCSACGGLNREDDNNCRRCGQSLPRPAANVTEENEYSYNWKPMLIAVLVGLAILLVLRCISII